MILPLILLILALLAAAIASYGSDPLWISYSHGLDLIYLSRRLQGPLFGVCIIVCLFVLILVISGKRRVWWLIGLAPILAMFAHRYATSPMKDFRVAENPSFVTSDDSATSNLPTPPPTHRVRPEDYVLGLTYNGTAYAYPYSALYLSPVVVQTLVQERIVILWSPYANFGRAFIADRTINPRELEVTSMPANALLVYNARVGQFINGITGKTPKGDTPSGFGRELPIVTTTFARWKQDHPNTQVMVAPEVGAAPPVPLRPRYAIPLPTTRPISQTTQLPTQLPRDTPVVLLSTTRPTALLPTDLSDTPVNFTASTESILAFRDPASGYPKAFSRVLTTGEEVRFAPKPGFMPTTRPGSFMFDTIQNYPWTTGAYLLEPTPTAKPDWKGTKLSPINTYEGGYYDVLKYWLPNLEIHQVTQDDFETLSPPPPPPKPAKPARQPAKKPVRKR